MAWPEIQHDNIPVPQDAPCSGDPRDLLPPQHVVEQPMTPALLSMLPLLSNLTTATSVLPGPWATVATRTTLPGTTQAQLLLLHKAFLTTLTLDSPRSVSSDFVL